MGAWKHHAVAGNPSGKASFSSGSVAVLLLHNNKPPTLTGLKQPPFYLLVILWVSNLGWALPVSPGVTHAAEFSWCLVI